MPLQFLLGVPCVNSLFFFIVDTAPLCSCTVIYVSIHSLKVVGPVPIFGHFEWNFCKHSCTDFCVNLKFLFL